MLYGVCVRGDVNSTLITPEQYYTASFTTNNKSNYYRFIPEEDQTLTFFSDSPYTTRAYIYNDDLSSVLQYNSSGSDGMNCKLTYNFKKGETYFKEM